MRLMVSAGALQLSPVLSKEKPYTCSFLAQFTQLMSLMLLSSSTLRSSVRSVLLLVLAQASLVLLTWHKNQEKQNQKIKKRCIFLFVRDEDYGLQATQCMLKLYFIFGFKITTHYFGSVVKIQDQRLFFHFQKIYQKLQKNFTLPFAGQFVSWRRRRCPHQWHRWLLRPLLLWPLLSTLWWKDPNEWRQDL